MKFTFGEKHPLHSTPMGNVTRVGYIPKNENGREEFVFAYDQSVVPTAWDLVELYRNSDVLRYEGSVEQVLLKCDTEIVLITIEEDNKFRKKNGKHIAGLERFMLEDIDDRLAAYQLPAGLIPYIFDRFHYVPVSRKNTEEFVFAFDAEKPPRKGHFVKPLPKAEITHPSFDRSIIYGGKDKDIEYVLTTVSLDDHLINTDPDVMKNVLFTVEGKALVDKNELF